ncbi:MAG: hypothetical protein LBN00_08325 [Oscillospiraceae bacterium]|jgi:hypothetical protein|nr:hypothetical protein [Oscillospiraceae bacterium]
MPDFERMYYRLFNRVTDAIEQLQEAQKEAENYFIENSDRPPLQIAQTAPEREPSDSENI